MGITTGGYKGFQYCLQKEGVAGQDRCCYSTTNYGANPNLSLEQAQQIAQEQSAPMSKLNDKARTRL